MLYDYYRQHVDVKWHDVTWPNPITEMESLSWRHCEEYREKEVQEGTKKKVKEELDKIASGA